MIVERLYRLLSDLRDFNREIKELNDFLKVNPQGFRDIIECWRDTNIILGRLVGLEVKYSTTNEETDDKKED